jgi:hypothetical protein
VLASMRATLVTQVTSERRIILAHDTGRSLTTNRDAKTLIEALTAKLNAQKDVLAAAEAGRLTWRWTSGGALEVKLQPDL